MSWQLVIPAGAVRDLKRIPGDAATDMVAALELYLTTGQGDVIKLKGRNPPQWRLRRGVWRALLAKDKAAQTVTVLYVGHRSDAYDL